MAPIGAPEERAAAKVSTTPPEIDWYLVGMDSTAACLFLIGLFALLVGLPALGLGLWAACIWLDWRVLAYVRTAPADSVSVRQYVASPRHDQRDRTGSGDSVGALLGGKRPLRVGLRHLGGSGWWDHV
jgi:hypothetical protein